MPPRQSAARRGGEDAILITGVISSIAAGVAFYKYRRHQRRADSISRATRISLAAAVPVLATASSSLPTPASGSVGNGSVPLVVSDVSTTNGSVIPTVATTIPSVTPIVPAVNSIPANVSNSVSGVSPPSMSAPSATGVPVVTLDPSSLSTPSNMSSAVTTPIPAAVGAPTTSSPVIASSSVAVGGTTAPSVAPVATPNTATTPLPGPAAPSLSLSSVATAASSSSIPVTTSSSVTTIPMDGRISRTNALVASGGRSYVVVEGIAHAPRPIMTHYGSSAGRHAVWYQLSERKESVRMMLGRQVGGSRMEPISHVPLTPADVLLVDGHATVGLRLPSDPHTLATATVISSSTFEPHSGSSSDFLADLSRGHVPKGVHKTELIVPDGTRLTVVGHLAEGAGGAELIGSPSATSQPMVVSTESFPAIIQRERAAGNTPWVWALAGAALAVACFVYVGGRYWQRHRAQIAEWRRAAEFQETRTLRKEERRRQREREIAREERLQRWKDTQEARQRLKHGASPLASAVGSPSRFVHVAKGADNNSNNNSGRTSASTNATVASSHGRHHRTPSGSRVPISSAPSSEGKAMHATTYDPYPSDTRPSHGHRSSTGGERKTMMRDSRDQSSDDDISDASSVDAVPIVLATPVASMVSPSSVAGVLPVVGNATPRSGVRWGPSTTQTIPAIGDEIVETDSDLPNPYHTDVHAHDVHEYHSDDASDDQNASLYTAGTTTGDEPSKCVVCRDQPANIAMIPCGHTHTCITCAQQVVKCPICRAKVTDRLRVYT